MTPYVRAWWNTALMLALMVATLPALVLLDRAVGGIAYLALFLAWIPLAFWLGWRVRCPACGTSPYVFGRGFKPWPNARCSRCGRDLRS